MDGYAAQGRLKGDAVVGPVAFALATPADDADIRRLLREGASDGWIRLSLERESDAFVEPVPAVRHGFIIARDKESGKIAGICEQVSRRAYVDGEPALLPYLGGLRVTPRFRNRIAVLRGGFRAVRELLGDPSALPYALTSVAVGNKVALRVLGAGLPGMPAYRALEEFSTFAIRPSGKYKPHPRCEIATAADIPAIAVHLQRSYRKNQFAPEWTAPLLSACRDLAPEDFIVIRRGPGIAACVALWDQRRFRQTVVRGYAAPLGKLRGIVNLAAPLTGMPLLPADGAPLGQVFLSHLAADNDDPEMFDAVVATAMAGAHARKFGVALLGLASRHPLAARVLKQHRTREYRTLLHLVHWEDGRAAAAALVVRMPHVEIAVL
jgi:hypothetical protein